MDARQLQIDPVHGLACVALVTFHTIGVDRTSGLRVADDHALRLFSDLLGYLRMPLFAFLSGVVYALRPISGDARAFIGAKVRRLLVPMLTFGTLFAILQANTPGANFARRDWAHLHIQPVAHYWFLESLFLIFMLIVFLERRQWLASRASFAAVWLASAVLFGIDPLPRTLGLQGAVCSSAVRPAGIGCRRFAGYGIADSRARNTAAALLCLLAAAAWVLSPGLPERNSAIALGLGAAGCVFLLHMRMRIRWLALLGASSFSIFLFHSIFSAASRIVLTRAVWRSVRAAPDQRRSRRSDVADRHRADAQANRPSGRFLAAGSEACGTRTTTRFKESTAAMPL